MGPGSSPRVFVYPAIGSTPLNQSPSGLQQSIIRELVLVIANAYSTASGRPQQTGVTKSLRNQEIVPAAEAVTLQTPLH